MSVDADFAAMIEKAANAYLRYNSRVSDAWQPLHGKVVGFDITTFNKQIFFRLREDGSLEAVTGYDSEPDTLIRGRAVDLFRLAVSDDGEAKAEISGDINLGRTFQRTFRQIDFDWEELLAPWFGDAIAHQIGRGARDFFGWLRYCGDALSDNIGEYLRDETRQVVDRDEVDAFIRKVDDLRDAVDRCEERLSRRGD